MPPADVSVTFISLRCFPGTTRTASTHPAAEATGQAPRRDVSKTFISAGVPQEGRDKRSTLQGSASHSFPLTACTNRPPTGQACCQQQNGPQRFPKSTASTVPALVHCQLTGCLFSIPGPSGAPLAPHRSRTGEALTVA